MPTHSSTPHAPLIAPRGVTSTPGAEPADPHTADPVEPDATERENRDAGADADGHNSNHPTTPRRSAQRT
ncbi:hypothetical protein [Acidovorax sp. RAC01]|uniref:hypothetical protein n=1 Tax=Acidovorax sp. RAC01 TaxID=1842533 RepID=UPI0008590B17|nr:hypothetical protein [Acidovorax sp. RAC01]AOG24927.1 hypothetical protein BSY15_2225 [Acidovorax sp. RAC01]